ncbi:uncharacterized protein LOC108087890 [Drosophila ficusphila]|uniref:uncharacterized protein LOC108087890 n=1 Tax=Drosophila ficusphila TaxID=30025 RepID=UPI0007E6F730|nr:uncharacterized protein LOC108087890 [Drosophila ficusphila]
MEFYYRPGSSHCRSVLMTAKALGVDFAKKTSMNLRAGEQFTPEYLKINPQHTIPTLVDGGLSLWESRAIMVYLVEKYGKDDKLFPKDVQKQALINQRFYFDMGTLYKSFADYYYPQIFFKKPANEENYKMIEVAFEFLNTFLEGQTYTAGEDYSLADISILATVSTFDMAGFDFKRYSNVARWYEHVNKITPGWEENWAGCLEFKKYFDNTRNFFMRLSLVDFLVCIKPTKSQSIFQLIVVLQVQQNSGLLIANLRFFNSKMEFYYRPGSCPCRSVLMTAKALGVEFAKKTIINTRAGEQFTPEYLKINPQHTIPTLVDGGLSLWESRAIMVYLVEKYGKDDKLFPKDVQKQALINQRFYFDMGTLYKSFSEYYYPQIFFKKPANEENYKKIEVAFEFLNTFLEGQTYTAGEDYSLADISILATVSTFDVAGFDFRRYSNVARWYEHVKKLTPGWEENWAGCQEFRKYFDN